MSKDGNKELLVTEPRAMEAVNKKQAYVATDVQPAAEDTGITRKIKFHLVTNYVQISGFHLIVTWTTSDKTKKREQEFRDLSFRPYPIEGLRKNTTEGLRKKDWVLAETEESITIRQKESVEYRFRIILKSDVPKETEKADLREHVNVISSLIEDKNDKNVIISRLIYLDIHLDRHLPFPDERIKWLHSKIQKLPSDIRSLYMKRWVEWKVPSKPSLTQPQLLFIVRTLETTMPFSTKKKEKLKPEDMLNANSAKTLMEAIRTQRGTDFHVSLHLAQWLLDSIHGSWLQALFYFSHHLEAIGDKEEENFELNEENWSKHEEMLNQMLISPNAEMLMKKVVRRITSRETLLSFINVGKRHEILKEEITDTQPWTDVKNVFHKLMTNENLHKNPTKIQELLKHSKYSSCSVLSECLCEFARSLILDDSTDIGKMPVRELAMMPEIYRNSKDVIELCNKLAKEIDKEASGLNYVLFRDFINTKQFKGLEQADLFEHVFCTMINMVKNVKNKEDFVNRYRFAIIHNKCRNISDWVVKCNEYLYGIEVKIEYLLSCFEKRRSIFSDEDLTFVVHHIVRQMYRDQKSPTVRIQQLDNIFQEIKTKRKCDWQQYLIGVEALGLIQDLERPFCFTDTLSAAAIPYFQSILSTKWSWEVVFGKYEKEDILTNLPLSELVKMLESTLSCIENGKCTFGFLSFVKKNEPDFYYLIQKLDGKHDRLTIQWFWQACFKANSMVTKCRRQADSLERYLKFLKGVFNDPDMMAKVNDEMMEMRQKIGDDSDFAIFNAIESESFWGELSLMREIATMTIDFIDSRTFVNICSNFIKSFHTSVSIFDFGTKMQANCIPEFREYKRRLSTNALDLRVSAASCYLQGINDDQMMDTELKRLFKDIKDIPSLSEHALKNFIRFRELKSKNRFTMLQMSIATFGISDQKSNIEEDVKTLGHLTEDMYETTTLREVNDAMDSINELQIQDADWDVLDQLGRCGELVSFLKPIIESGEDLRNLLEAVEEHDDLHVGIVEDLIDVKRIVEALLECYGVKEFVSVVGEKKFIGDKVKVCIGSIFALKNLHSRMANREEMMTGVIRNTLTCAVFTFALAKDEDSYLPTMSFSKRSVSKTYTLEELNDLKSRAMFANSKSMTLQADEDTGGDLGSSAENKSFIHMINVVEEINDTLNSLYNAGHFDYAFGKTLCTLETNPKESLDRLLNTLRCEYTTWKRILQEGRSKYYYLNFFRSRYLRFLDELDGKKVGRRLTIEQLFTHISEISLNDQLSEQRTTVQYTDEMDLLADAHSMQAYEDELTARISSIGLQIKEHVDITYVSSTSIHGHTNSEQDGQVSSVQHGKVFVVDHDSKNSSISTLLKVYQNRYGIVSQLSFWQVLFCHQSTPVEDVALLLERCAGAYANGRRHSLFSLVNVEQLSREAQIYIVDKVRRLHETDKHFLLAIISCRDQSTGGSSYVLSQFAPDYTHKLSGLTDNEMATWLREKWPDFEIVTSEIPGIGKTEYIKSKAVRLQRDVAEVSISGAITRDSLVTQLCRQSQDEHKLLHLDAGMVSDPSLLDSFILELAVIGTVYSGIHVFCLQAQYICLEIATTYQDELLQSISACKYFKKHCLTWNDNFASFTVSMEPKSAVQVVCQYLIALESTELDKRDIKLTEATLLSADECRRLLKAQFQNVKKSDLSFTRVETYLNVFAEELKKLSASNYFGVGAIKTRLEEKGTNLRTQLVNELNEMSKTFGIHEINSASSGQAEQASDTSPRKVSNAGVKDMIGRTKNTSASIGQTEQASDKSPREVSKAGAMNMIGRTNNIIKWEDSNHTLVVFNSQDSNTISPLYRHVEHLPESIQKLFEIQRHKLPDYNKLEEGNLRLVLEKVCRTQKTTVDTSTLNYVLTPDNLLKMIIIFKRIKARIPVVLMGETGCGKTLLIRYLAKVCDVSLNIFNVHAGTNISDISKFVERVKKDAAHLQGTSERPIWVFFDEINTCEHLGVLGEIIVHKSFRGRYLPTNLVFIAACNPYIKQKTSSITEGGLGGRVKVDNKSDLVYRVEPLPERILQYVWNFGSLQKNDEKRYIKRMLRVQEIGVSSELEDAFALAVFKSQVLVRRIKHDYSVSLRDVRRCNQLAEFFITKWLKWKALADLDCSNIQTATMPGEKKEELFVRGIILALAHCYQSRFQCHENRKIYLAMVSKKLRSSHSYVTEKYVEAVIDAEQIYLLQQMELPEGTALNSALKENVFVVLVSILARIPIFVVGKPGCSKSLSLQLIKNNLKGKDSKSEFFKQLPVVYMLSYQGSDSSTSEGISQIFDRAKRQSEKQGEQTLTVILLDEVGLAEASQSNPLKVLHSLLEPLENEIKLPVVGLSNWALDAAKMNRAIYLTRPMPTTDDLFETAKAIRNDIEKGAKFATDEQLENLAKAYSSYTTNQTPQNFHGLRDYYALVKYISQPQDEKTPHGASQPPSKDTKPEIRQTPADNLTSSLTSGLLRNFAGLKRNEVKRMMGYFFHEMKLHYKAESEQSVLERITNNLSDEKARHLMIIINDGSMVAFLEKTLRSMQDQKYVVIFGSQFEHDRSEEYFYKVLSEIILYMEKGVTLVLKDLKHIYGSLYDMLNQNYTWTGNKRYCRIALGPHKSPLCEVHAKFRCIVLIDEHNVDPGNDSPFLNRFEKQMLTFEDLLSSEQSNAFKQLETWIADLQSIEKQTECNTKSEAQCSVSNEETIHKVHSESKRRLEDDLFKRERIRTTDPGVIFYGFNIHNLASVVFQLQISEDHQRSLFQRCKDELMPTACPSEVLRSQKSKLAVKSPSEVKEFVSRYFDLPQHNGLAGFVRSVLKGGIGTVDDDGLTSTRKPTLHSMTVVYTLSSIHHNLDDLLSTVCHAEVEKLWTFKSEQQFSERLKKFWFNSEAEFLIVQSLPTSDGASMQQARYLLEKSNEEYITMNTSNKPKHMVILVHINRPGAGNERHLWQFGHLPSWSQVTIDCLTEPKLSLKDIIEAPLSEIINDLEDTEIQSLVQGEIKWCIACLRYRTQKRSVNNSHELEQRIISSRMLEIYFIKPQIIKAEKERENTLSDTGSNWLVELACDKGLLHTYGTLNAAVNMYLRLRIRSSLGKIIYFIESKSAWKGIGYADGITFDFWKHCFQSTDMFDISSPSIPEPRGPNSCLISTKCHRFNFPFFSVFNERIEKYKGWWREESRKLARDGSPSGSKEELLSTRLADSIHNDIPQIEYTGYLDSNTDAFVEDVYKIFTDDHNIDVTTEDSVDIVKWYFTKKVNGQIAAGLSRIASLYIELWSSEDEIVTELQLLLMYKRFRNDRDTLTHLRMLAQEIGLESNDTEDFVTVLENVLEQICQLALLTNEDLQASGGMKTWQQNVALVIYYAEKFRCKDVEPLSFHFLRLYRDYVNILVPHFKLVALELVEFAEIGRHLEKSLTGDVLKFVENQIQRLIAKQPNDRASYDAIQDFRTMYFVRAFEANPDKFPMEMMLKSLSMIDGKPTAGASSVLYRVMLTDVNEYEPLEEENDEYTMGDSTIINEDPDFDYNYPNLQILDQFLANVGPANHLAVMCCDLIEKIAFSHVTLKRIQHLTTDEDLIFKTASGAVHTICTSNQCCLRLLFAISFVSALFKSLTELGIQSFVDLCKSNKLIGDLVNVLLGGHLKQDTSEGLGPKRLHAVCVYFLKMLRGPADLRELKSACKHLEESISTLKSMQWPTTTDEWQWSPMRYLTLYNDMLGGVDAWKPGDDPKMPEVMIKVADQQKYQRALLAVLIDRFFLAKASRSLEGAKREQAKRLLEWVKTHERLQPEYKRVAEFLLEEDTPYIEHQTLGSKGKEKKICQLSVIVHLASVLISSISGNLRETSLLTCMFPGEKAQRSFFPASGIPQKVLSDEKIINMSYERRVCPSCNHELVIMITTKQKDKMHDCPVCSTPFENNVFSALQYKSKRVDHNRGYHRRSNEDASDVDLSIRSITPIWYRILNVLLHGAFLMGVSMDQESCQRFAFLLDGQKDVRSTDMKSSIEAFLWVHINTDWDILEELLECGTEHTAMFLHQVIIEGANTLLSTHFTSNDWENRISETIEKKLHTPTEECSKFMKTSTNLAAGASKLRLELEEVSDVIKEEHSDTFRRYFRRKRVSSYRSLKVSVINNIDMLVQNHQFLCLFVSMKELLELVSCIIPLLKWHLLVTDMLNHRIDRKEANKTMKSFLENTTLGSSETEGRANTVLFVEFRKSWNLVRNNWKLITGDEPYFGEMSEEQSMLLCLAEDVNNSSPLLDVINVLVDLQNNFLKKVLCVAASEKCNALSFLLKDDHTAGLPTVPLIEASEHIIDFKWEDKYLVHSHADTEYGRGNILRYNYAGLERRLCEVLVLNKALLTVDQTFTKFTFKEELYNAFGSIREIHSHIPQEKLPAEIAEAVSKFQPDETKKLMEQLDIVGPFLKHPSTEAVRRDEPLVEYIKSNLNTTPAGCLLSCDPHASVKLCHIENLYERLEQTAATKVVIPALSSEFHETINSDEMLANRFKMQVEVADVKQMEHVVSIVKIFVYRYLRQEVVNSSLEQVIQQRANEIYLKPDDVETVKNFLLPEIQLCHIVNVLAILQKEIDIKNRKGESRLLMRQKKINPDRRRRRTAMID